MAGKHVEWRQLPDHPTFEINRLGELRMTKNGRKMDPAFNAKFYYGLRTADNDRAKVVRDLIRTAFPDVPNVTYKSQKIGF